RPAAPLLPSCRPHAALLRPRAAEHGAAEHGPTMTTEVANRVEVAVCQLCGSRERSVAFTEPPWQVVRCSGCGLVYVTPRLSGEALREVYGESYWCSDTPKTRGYADYARDADLYLKTFRRRFLLVRQHFGDRP